MKRIGQASKGRAAKKASNGARSNGWGGARQGAGRKPKGDVAGVAHRARDVVDPGKPVRVTLKIAKDVPDLRNKTVTRIVEAAVYDANTLRGFRVLHRTIERDRLVLIVEAKDAAILSRGMKGFNVRFARNLNAFLKRSGSVLADRYEAEQLKSPRDLKLALRGNSA